MIHDRFGFELNPNLLDKSPNAKIDNVGTLKIIKKIYQSLDGAITSRIRHKTTKNSVINKTLIFSDLFLIRLY